MLNIQTLRSSGIIFNNGLSTQVVLTVEAQVLVVERAGLVRYIYTEFVIETNVI